VVDVVRVAKFLTAISTWFWDGVDVRRANTDGQTSAVLRRDSTVQAVLTVRMCGMRTLNANFWQSQHGVLTGRPETLTTDFFVNRLDMGME